MRTSIRTHLAHTITGIAATVVAALAVASPAAAAEVAKQQPIGPQASASVIGGYYPHPTQWPWMAAVLERSRGSTDFTRQICGGALVHPRVIVTAAHCVVADGRVTAPSNLEILLGRRQLSVAAGERIGVTRVEVHPSYDRPYLSHDVALLHLDRPSTAPVATLLEPQFTLYQGNLVTVMGWGSTAYDRADYDRVRSDHLKALDVVIWGDETCRRSGQTTNDAYYYSRHYDPATMICAGDSGSRQATCQGDSGSPMMVKNTAGQWRLVGVVSWGGITCGGGSSPTAYAWLHGARLRAFVNAGIAGAARLTGTSPTRTTSTVPTRTTGSPQLSHARLAKIHVRRGRPLRIRFRSSLAGKVTIAYRRGGRSLTSWVATARSGANTIVVPTRSGRRNLRRGVYRLSLQLTGQSGQRSNAVPLGFRIR